MTKTFEQMTKDERANAYAMVQRLYDLRAAERDLLDQSDLYQRILERAHNQEWANLKILVQMLRQDFAVAQAEKLAASEPVGHLHAGEVPAC